MRKCLFFNLLLLAAGAVASCQSAPLGKGKEIPVEIVFEEWRLQFGMVQSIDVILKGKNKRGEAVELPTKLGINQYDEYLLPMLAKLEEEGQRTDGNTGSGLLQINKKRGRPKLAVVKVGNVAVKNMEFLLEEEEVAVFLQ